MNVLQFTDLQQPAVRSIIMIALAALASYAFAQRANRSIFDFLKKEIGSQSKSISMVVGTVKPDGGLEEDFSYNADTPLPLASTIKIFVLAAYAQEVVEGRLDPKTEVSTADWEAYYLPGTDGGAHQSALETLGIKTDKLGFAQTQQTVTLDNIVAAMLTASDNAATDYVMKSVGEQALQRVIDQNELAAQDLPASFLGSFLALQNQDDPELKIYSLEEMREAADKYEALYISDKAWREAYMKWLKETGFSEPFDDYIAAFQGFGRGSATDYAKIMAGVVTETFISPEVSRIMREKLEWPMQLAGSDMQFETYGTKGGSLPGIITEATYIRTSTGDYSSKNRVVVLFMTNLAEKHYNDLAQNASHQGAMRELAKHSKALKPLLAAQQALD